MARKRRDFIRDILERVKLEGVDPAHRSPIYGVPMPGITMHWLIGLPYWPLGRIIHLAGPEKSYKTSLGYEIGRWFIDHGGYLVYVHTEGRDNPAQRESILGSSERVVVMMADTVEQWNRQVLGVVQACIDARDEGDPVPPMCIVIDSLVGTLSEHGMKQIERDGFAQSAFPRDALITTRFLQYLTKKINDLPISVIIINHLRPDLNSFNPSAKRTPGGSSIKYFEFIEIWSDALAPTPKGEVPMQLSVRNSTVGPPGRGISTLIRWGDDNSAEFDWEYTGVLWLRDPSRDRNACGRNVDHKRLVASIQSVLGEVRFSPAHKTVTCQALGIEKASVREFWIALHASPLWEELLRSIGVRTDLVQLYEYEEVLEQEDG